MSDSFCIAFLIKSSTIRYYAVLRRAEAAITHACGIASSLPWAARWIHLTNLYLTDAFILKYSVIYSGGVILLFAWVFICLKYNYQGYVLTMIFLQRAYP